MTLPIITEPSRPTPGHRRPVSTGGLRSTPPSPSPRNLSWYESAKRGLTQTFASRRGLEGLFVGMGSGVIAGMGVSLLLPAGLTGIAGLMLCTLGRAALTTFTQDTLQYAYNALFHSDETSDFWKDLQRDGWENSLGEFAERAFLSLVRGGAFAQAAGNLINTLVSQGGQNIAGSLGIMHEAYRGEDRNFAERLASAGVVHAAHIGARHAGSILVAPSAVSCRSNELPQFFRNLQIPEKTTHLVVEISENPNQYKIKGTDVEGVFGNSNLRNVYLLYGADDIAHVKISGFKISFTQVGAADLNRIREQRPNVHTITLSILAEQNTSLPAPSKTAPAAKPTQPETPPQKTPAAVTPSPKARVAATRPPTTVSERSGLLVCGKRVSWNHAGNVLLHFKNRVDTKTWNSPDYPDVPALIENQRIDLRWPKPQTDHFVANIHKKGLSDILRFIRKMPGLSALEHDAILAFYLRRIAELRQSNS